MAKGRPLMFSLLAAYHEILHWAGIIACVAGAVAAMVYVPGRLGGALAAVALAAASGLVAYDEGYRARGVLDQSAELRQQIAERDAQITEQSREAQAARAIASAAAERIAAAERLSSDLQEQVDDYADALTKLPKDAACGLSDADVRGLSAIGRASDKTGTPPHSPTVRKAR